MVVSIDRLYIIHSFSNELFSIEEDNNPVFGKLFISIGLKYLISV